jgi:signal transduction histidine kinase
MNIHIRFLVYFRYILFLAFILTGSRAIAQEENDTPPWKTIYNNGQHIIDSLKNILKTQSLTDKQHLDIYVAMLNFYAGYEIDSLKVYAPTVIELARKLNEYQDIIGCHAHLGMAYCFTSEYDTAFIYLNRMKEIAIEQGSKEWETDAVSLIAVTYAKQGKYHTAIDYFLEALKMAERLDMIDRCVMALTNISELNRRLCNTETAIQYLKQAEEKCNYLDENRWSVRITHIYNEYAFNYLNSGNLDEALRYALKTESLLSSIINMCYNKGLLATIYLQQNQYDRALQYAKESYEHANMLNDKNLYAYAGKILSDVYIAQKRYPEAEAEALKVWETDSTDIDESRAIVENIALANIYMGNTEKAAYYLKKYSELNKQYSEKSFHTTMSDLAIKYETEKKEIRISALEKEKQLYLWLIMAGAAILLLVIGLTHFRQRLHKQRVKQLEQEKQLVATQAVLDGENAERSRLARDLHDGLGGMLSVVKLNLKDMKHSAVMDGVDVERYGQALEMLDQSIGELRRVAHHIMPESLIRYGLKVSLEDFCHVIPNAHFQYLGESPRLDSRLEVLIYRCAYELINNAVKHAHATTINVQLIIDDGVISLTVHDDGIGFDPQTVNFGMGLENIRTRIAVYNGKMTIHSSPETGTEICIEIEPLQ